MSPLKSKPKFAALLLTVLGFGLAVALLSRCGHQSNSTDDDQNAEASFVPPSWSGDEDLPSDHWTIEEL